MLNKSQKETIIQKLKEKLVNNKVLVVADFRGLSVKDMNDLKKQIREIGGSVQVAKKTLINLALQAEKIDFDTRQFSGPLAFIFGIAETEVPKKIWSFAKKNDKIKIEGGLLEGKIISLAEVESLAKMPSKKELLGKLVGTVQGPVRGFVYVLSGTIGSLVNVLKAVEDQKKSQSA